MVSIPARVFGEVCVLESALSMGLLWETNTYLQEESWAATKRTRQEVGNATTGKQVGGEERAAGHEGAFL